MEVDQSHLQEVNNNDICYMVGVVRVLVIILANVGPREPVTGKCQLCIRENSILSLGPHLAIQNKRKEIFSNYRHEETET